MSDQPTEAPESQPDEPQEGDESKTFDAEYVKKLRDEAARYRTEAKANANAAQRLAEIEDEQKTETQRLTDQLAAEKAQRETVEQEALRFRVAAAKGVPADLIDRLRGDTEDELSADADALLNLVGAQKKNGLHVPREGSTSQPKDDEMTRFTRQLFESANP